MLVLISSIITNFAAAQQSTKSIGIKITSPIKGQLIPLPDNDLRISGIASHNGSLTCNVYIIVNDIKPYQKALTTGGHNNIKDYSAWLYNLVPSYTTIKTGTNKITSKLACQGNNTSLTQYYGINVTGAAHSLKNLSDSNMRKEQTSTEKENVPISNDHLKRIGSAYANSQPVTLLSTAGILSLSTPRVDKHSDLTTRLTTKAGDISLNNNSSTESAKEQSNTSPVDTTQKTSFGSNHRNNITKSISISMHLAKGPIHVGNRENLTVAVTDSNSTHVIPGAAIFGKIVNPSGLSKKLEGTADEKGKVLYSWQISGDDTSGKYKVLMEASAPGYENNSVSKTFTVLPIRTMIYNKDNGMTNVSSDLRNNPSNANSRLILLPNKYTNLNSPLIFSNQNPPPPIAPQSRVYIPSANNLNYENSRVYIPSSRHNNDNNNNVISTYNKVGIPNPNTNSTIEQGLNPIQKPIEQGLNPIQKPIEQGLNPIQKPIEQGLNPIQKPQLPNNQEPFVMATPLLHINNGTYGTSQQLSSTATAIAVDLVDRMRVMGFDSGLMSSP
jgi:hypothetical protein